MKPEKEMSCGVDPKYVSAFCLSGTMRGHSTAKLHFHPFHQILFIREGITVLEEPAEKKPLFGNMTAFIPAGLKHKSLVLGESVEYIALYFQKDFLQTEYGQIIIFSISPLAIELLNSISVNRRHDITQGVTGDCFRLFLKILNSDLKNEINNIRLPIARDRKNKKIITYIHTHYTDKITFKNILAFSPYSKRHIHRRFLKDLKITIFEYLRLYRAFMSAVLLSRGDVNVTGIAFDCGYESLSGFYADFRKYFGVTPGKFHQNKFLSRASSLPETL